jgi:hypothetical protein
MFPAITEDGIKTASIVPRKESPEVLPGSIIFGREYNIIRKTRCKHIPVADNLIFPQGIHALLPEITNSGLGSMYCRHRSIKNPNRGILTTYRAV